MTAQITVSDVWTTATCVRMSLVFVSNVNRLLPLQPTKLVAVFQPNFWIEIRHKTQAIALTYQTADQLFTIPALITVQAAPRIVMYAVFALVNALSAYQHSP